MDDIHLFIWVFSNFYKIALSALQSSHLAAESSLLFRFTFSFLHLRKFCLCFCSFPSVQKTCTLLSALLEKCFLLLMSKPQPSAGESQQYLRLISFNFSACCPPSLWFLRAQSAFHGFISAFLTFPSFLACFTHALDEDRSKSPWLQLKQHRAR